MNPELTWGGGFASNTYFFYVDDVLMYSSPNEEEVRAVAEKWCKNHNVQCPEKFIWNGTL